MSSRPIVKIYEGLNGKPAGTLYFDGIYETTRSTTRHFFKKFSGYGVSKSILDDLKKQGCVYVDIQEYDDQSNTRTLRSDINRWYSFQASSWSWEGDAQVVLPVRAMEDTRTRKMWKAGAIQEKLT